MTQIAPDGASGLRWPRGSGGVRLALERIGDGDGPAGLLLPGGGQTRHSWRATAVALGERGYDSWIADLRGHGASDWHDAGDYSLDAFRDDVVALIEEIGRPAAVVGASQGGVAALLAAGEGKAAGIRALAMVDIGTRVDPQGGEKIFAFMRAAPDGFADLQEASDLVASFMPDRPKPRDPSGLMRNLKRREDGRLIWHWDPRYVGEDGLESAMARQQRKERATANVVIPMLVVRGERSEILSAVDARAFAALVPGGARVTEIAGAGHMIVGDQNGAFSSAVAEFLKAALGSP